MKKLTKEEIETILLLVKRGYSLNKIREKLNKSKTTIYYHFRKVKGKSFEPININSSDEDALGEFIGLFAGDGCLDKTKVYQYRTYLYFNITERTFVDSLIENVLIKLFGKKPMIFISPNRINLCYYSKNIHTLIRKYLEWKTGSRKTYSVKLISEHHSKEFIFGFIRGSLDSDGYFSQKKISFATVSEGLMRNISSFLTKLEIKYYVNLYREKRLNRKDIYHIILHKSEHIKFIQLIKPRNIRS
jgi:hypothetical protein